MKHYLVKGKVRYGNAWRGFSEPVSGEDVTAKDAILKAKWKLRKSDQVCVESVYRMVWQREKKEKE